mgnify:CR=1 FL=1
MPEPLELCTECGCKYAHQFGCSVALAEGPTWVQRSMKQLRAVVFRRDNGTCVYCGEPAENLDHVRPRSKGGKDDTDNLVASCIPCNSAKGSMRSKTFRRRLRLGLGGKTDA